MAMLRKRVLSAATGAALVTGFALMAAPTAAADTVSPFQTAAAGPHGYGAVNISTEAGGFIAVSVSGRTNAINSGMPGDGVCMVNVGDSGGRMRLDATGSGVLRFGPLSNGTYRVQGSCPDRADGRIGLTNPGIVTVVIDGQGPTGFSSHGPKPPSVETMSQYCDRMVDTANGVGTAVALAGLAFPPATAVGLPVAAAVMAASLAIRGNCQYYATQVGDAGTVAQQFCGSVEDVIKGSLDALPVKVPIGTLLPKFC